MVPSPRSSRSTSASTKPSVLASMASRRAVGLGRVGLGQQEAPRRLAAPAHPTPQLVELGDAEPVGVLDDHDRGLGDVDARPR